MLRLCFNLTLVAKEFLQGLLRIDYALVISKRVKFLLKETKETNTATNEIIRTPSALEKFIQWIKNYSYIVGAYKAFR